MKILIACEFSGIVREEFNKLGHNVWSCDLLDSEIPGKHIKDNVLNHLDKDWDLMIAHPPCTHLAVSGARWFKEKRIQQSQALAFFIMLLNAPIKKICIENPVSVASWIRKPTQYIQPFEHGHGETKKTGLWLKGLPKLKPSNIVGGRENRIHRMPPSKERWKERSRTFPGIAKAMAEQWGKFA